MLFCLICKFIINKIRIKFLLSKALLTTLVENMPVPGTNILSNMITLVTPCLDQPRGGGVLG